MNRLYGFLEEVNQKYGPALYKHIESVFDSLPLAHIINHSIFVVHGGLCNDQSLTLSDIQKINRFREPLATGPVHDLLWSDPMDGEGFLASERCDNGQTKFFGSDVTAKFLESNNLKLLIRSHQVQEEGFSITQNGKCMTIFSAPNYIGQVGNKGAIVKLFFEENGELKDSEIVKFDSVQKWGPEKVEQENDEGSNDENGQKNE